ncbi:anhydro-N-acetylmuramic acid kinase [Pseudofulvibacter geojedonensis]|uniref:Anhydro-N-acetylmuramic acid kinase n=1 Tax=Pseudofulvibacter geojedonensis TaxID=1123758 RepID=A0ABW3I4A9_9FLAO
MIKDEYFVLGVMSGTSLDGVDLAYVKFERKDTWTYDIILAETKSYTNFWEEELRKAINYTDKALIELDKRYTKYLASFITDFILKYQLNKIDAICSHGHTILHQPENKLTLQIGNLPIIADLIKQKVVCNFRIQDVKLGGQGAPLVPIGDQLLFSEYDYCLNLGGFSNLSTKMKENRVAYDISPVNIVMNHYVKELGLNYDDKGKIAASGALHNELLQELNKIKFYHENAPKSLGLEWVKQHIYPLIDSFQLSTPDILRTFVEHVAIQISSQFEANSKVLITGGGAYNDFLISRVRRLCDTEIVIPDNTLLEFKEALIFAFLGVLRLRGEVNVLASVTGASRDHSSGCIFNYNNSN